MELVSLTYNVLLLVLFSIVLTLTALYYHGFHKKLFLIASILFFVFIMDDLIIFMTEMIDWFSRLYDKAFMYVPTYKTLIFVSVYICMIEINSYLLNIKKTGCYIGLGILTVLLLCIPAFRNSALKVWLYYTPNQVFTFILSLYSIRYLKKNKEKFEESFYSRYLKLLICFAVFSVLIVIEDSIVIFNFDIYTGSDIFIHNRSVSEDILHIIFSIYAIRVLVHTLEITEAEIRARAAVNIQEMSASDTQKDTSEEEHYIKFYKFCKAYQLTTREQDILGLLLDNKNNQEISDELLISIGTTKTHTHNIFQKIGVAKRSQLLEVFEEYQPE